MKIEGMSKVASVYEAQKVSHIVTDNKVQMQNDTVAVSSNARDYNLVMKTLKNVPDVRTDLVDQIQNQLNSGSYDVSGKDIVDKVQQGLFDQKI